MPRSVRAIAWLIAAVAVLAAGDALAMPLSPNALGVRLGYHNFVGVGRGQWPDNDGLLEDGEFDYDVHPEDLDGVSCDVEYARRFHDVFSLALSAGVYGGRSSFATTAEKARVSGSWSVLVFPVLLTPRFHLRLDPIDLYTGGGVGIYFLRTDFRLRVDDGAVARNERADEVRSKVGWHVLLGLEWRFHRSWSVLIEDRFAFVHVKGGSRETDVDDFDAGGNQLFLGARWHF
jgi:opacity protein-like surface antigen